MITLGDHLWRPLQAHQRKNVEPHCAELVPRDNCCLGLKRKARLDLYLAMHDRAGEELAQEERPIAFLEIARRELPILSPPGA